MYGDSNFGKVNFAKMGQALPGVRDFAARVEHLEPVKCSAYKNVVLMMGTNDIKQPGLTNTDDKVKELYIAYKAKIAQVRQLNPKCRLFVCPVLPTRNTEINVKVKLFNRYLMSDLKRSNLRVNVVEGFEVFWSRFTNKLCDDLSNIVEDPSDTLHLNAGKGVITLVSLIKHCIFTVKKAQSSNRNSARRGNQGKQRSDRPNR